MTDNEYRNVVIQTIRSREYYIATIKFYRPDHDSKRLAWLKLMGLMETWDVV